MNAQNIFEKIKDLELRSRKISRGLLLGGSRSSVHGSGIDFDQIRDYQVGDDLRFIDWKSSARSNKMLVKQYKEDKTETVLLAVDISASSWYGSQQHHKYDYQSTLACVLALVSSNANDAVGLLLFSDSVELYIAPRTGKKHIHAIITALLNVVPTDKQTNISRAFDYIAQIKKRAMMVCVISDFIDEKPFEQTLSLVARNHDLVAMICKDTKEMALPAVGFLVIEDYETGEQGLVDLSHSGSHAMEKFLTQRSQAQELMCQKVGAELMHIEVGRSVEEILIPFLQRRIR